ncbi:MAG TPA: MBL fold metallo-hydrolase [Burkholderiales bacterium]|nr:MBL fold metallo-hydrolase [Burkholderiales bacterium]
MELTFLGATGTVTGSKTLVAAGGRRLLVDCGLFQGLKALRLRNRAPLPVAPSSLDAVLLTHAHLDHSGYLPLLARDGFRGRIYCSDATRDLCAILLPDSGHLQEEEAEYANRGGFSRHHPALPLYTEEDARRCLAQFHPVPFGTPIDLGAAGTARLRRAGHILGAAMVELQSGGRRILFSGDLGRPRDALMPAPEAAGDVDYLVLESTYGDRRHEPGDPGDRLADIIGRTAARGGVVVVPTFAVGRAQQLTFHLHRLKRERRIPDIPMYLNSPMAVDASTIFRAHPADHRLSPPDCAAMFADVQIVNTVEQSRRLNQSRGPMIILAASGMATGGRVVHHLKAFAPDPRNTILLAGFQAAGTRGAALQAGARAIKIHGQYVPVNAQVEVLDSLSAHADTDEILEWLGGFARAPRRTFLNHGEPVSADTLRRRIEEDKGWEVTVPDYREAFELP